MRLLWIPVLAMVLVSLLMIPIPRSATAQDATPAMCQATTPEQNAALARAYWAEIVWGKQGTIADIVAPDEIHHWGVFDDTTGFAAFAGRMATFLAAFPDLEFTVAAVVAQDDLVATHWTATGTQTGEWQGSAPTGRQVAWSGLSIFRIACGQIAEAWGVADHIGLLRQIGAIDVPPPLTPIAESSPLATPAATPCAGDTPAANSTLARRWMEDVLDDQNLGVLDEILDPAIVHHGSTVPDARGIAAVKEALGGLLETLPDMTVTVDQTVAGGDLVFMRWSGTATPAAPYVGVEPTGTTVNLNGINLYRIDCGRITESWSMVNALSVLRQLQEASGAGTPVPA